MSDVLNPRINVRLGVFRHNKLVDVRETHNVMTNIGRTWLLKLLGATSYADASPTPHLTSKLRYMGFGCGGKLQTDARFSKLQQEVASITVLEAPVTLSIDGNGVETYLKSILPQAANAIFFPGENRAVFVCNTLESDIAFAASKIFNTNTVVGTSVPVSEAGLFLSTATPTGTPLQPAQMVCYNIFDPVIVTPNTQLRMEWEIRL